MSRTLFIWDIHGCHDELVDLYRKMWASEKDTVYATGDVINGWPKSFEVLQFLVANNVQSVIGNHELSFFEYFADTNTDKKRKPIFDELIKKLKWQTELWSYLRDLPKYIEMYRFLLVHAGLKPGIDIQDQDINDLARIREHEGRAWHEYYTGEKKIIYGHWAEQGLRHTHNTLWIDTSCVWWGHLTGYCLETEEFWQVRAKKPYRSWEIW